MVGRDVQGNREAWNVEIKELLLRQIYEKLKDITETFARRSGK